MSEPSLWTRGRPHERHADLYAEEYAKQLERIARIRSRVSAGLPAVPAEPPRRAEPGPRWDAAPANLVEAAVARAPTEAPTRSPADGDLGRQTRRLADPGAVAAAAGGERRRRTPARRLWVAGAVVVAAAATAVAVAVLRGEDVPVSTTFRVPGQPTGLAVADGRVWVAGPGAGEIWILDGASGRPAAAPLRTGGTPARLALDSRWAWIADTERGALLRIARGGGVARRLAGGPDVTDVAVAEGAVWTTSSADGTVRVRDARGRRRVLHAGVRPLALAADERHVVAADAGSRALLRLQPAAVPVHLGGSPVDVALAGERAWVADAAAGTVRPVDLARGVLGPPVAIGPATVAVAADAGGVYAVSRGDRTLVELDPVSGEVRSRVQLAHPPTALALDPRHVWIAAGDQEVIRVDR